MKDFQSYLNNIGESDKKERMESILKYIKKTFPQLKEEIKWNQPMFTDHGTFIIGFSIAKAHIACFPWRIIRQKYTQSLGIIGIFGCSASPN
jgi:uncharacterized protein YdhG (YjbR/CyaY superfamily)